MNHNGSQHSQGVRTDHPLGGDNPKLEQWVGCPESRLHLLREGLWWLQAGPPNNTSTQLRHLVASLEEMAGLKSEKGSRTTFGGLPDIFLCAL